MTVGLTVMLQDQFIMVGVVLVGGDNYLLARLKSTQHLVVPGILTTNADITLHSKLFCSSSTKTHCPPVVW